MDFGGGGGNAFCGKMFISSLIEMHLLLQGLLRGNGNTDPIEP
jgi:hypothetical protein